MIERRPGLDLLAHAVLLLGVLVVAFPVYVTFVAMPEVTAIQATSLDDPGQFNPHAVTYTVRAHAWDTIDPALQPFERMPG